MSEDKAGFTVSDRRRSRTEGEAREAEPPEEAIGGDVHPGASDTELSEVDFAGFILSLAAQASVLLRGSGDSSGAETASARDIESARRIISILEMLRDKTEGRRSAEETGLLESLLFELRMGYVARARKGEQ